MRVIRDDYGLFVIVYLVSWYYIAKTDAAEWYEAEVATGKYFPWIFPSQEYYCTEQNVAESDQLMISIN